MNLLQTIITGLLLGLCVSVAADSEVKQGRALQLADLDKLQTVGDPQLSPDGNWIVYSVSSVDPKEDKDISNIWISDWNGEQARALTYNKANNHHPRWSADGRYLAYLSDKDDDKGQQQLWLLDGHAGEPRKMTSFAGGVWDLAWAPDSRQLALVVSVDNVYPVDDTPRPIVIDRYYFKEDESGYLETARSHLFLLDIDSGNSLQLTHGPYDELLPSWSPDGDKIAFVSKRGEDFDRHHNWDIYLTRPKSGATQELLTQNPGTDCEPSWCDASPPVWHPDGGRLSYIRGGDPNLTWFALQQIATIATSGDQEEQLPSADLDRNTINPQWSANGKHLYFLLEDNLSQYLARLELRSGKITRLTRSGRVVSQFDVGVDNKIVLLSSTADTAYEIGVLEGNTYRALHDHNPWLNDVVMAKTQAIEFPSKDGTVIHALLVKPSDFQAGVTYPVIMRLHGGPVAQHAFDFHFDWQLYAANGYVVIAPNPRGSSGKGLGFQKSTIGDWGNLDVDDVLASIDYLLDLGIADENRLGVGGWSYGAMLTNYVIASDQRFGAAVSGAGISNMLAGYGTDMYIRDWNIELGAPWENLDKWLQVSYPFYQADRITTPTLFLCGELDFNVPLIHSEQMYQALRQLNVPTRLVIYPDEYHEFYRPSFRLDEMGRQLHWYDSYLSNNKN